MKKILLAFVIILQSVATMASEDVLAVTKAGVVVDYKTETVYGKKVYLQYVRISTTTVNESEGALSVTYIMEYLNKKKAPQKGTNFTDGIQTSFTVQEDGSYYLQDIGYGIGKDLVRNGFKLHIPKSLMVGDSVTGGHSYGSYKWLGSNVKFDLNYNDFKVVGEESIETPVGAFKCFKIEGKVVGKSSNNDIDDNHALWIAPGVGVVKMEYVNPKWKTVLTIDTITGLQ